MKTTTGIIGFFDILGYQNLVDNNPVCGGFNQTALEVVSQLKEMPQVSKKAVEAFFKDCKTGDVISNVKCLLFSDTILLHSAYSENDNGLKKIIRWLVFIMHAATLQRRMFDYGLPLRGSISFGDYYVDEASPCFVGKPIMEAYKKSNRLELSAIVLNAEAQKEIEGIKVGKSGGSAVLNSALLVKDYLVPLKGSAFERLNVVNFAINTIDRSRPPLGQDARSLVIDSFSKHRKDVSPQVYPKIDNTEMLLRHMFRINEERKIVDKKVE